MENQKKPGRPRLYKDNAERTRLWRAKNSDTVRYEIRVQKPVSDKLVDMSGKMGCTISQVIEKLVYDWDKNL